MMTHASIEQLGIGGIFALMILHVVFNFLKDRKSGLSEIQWGKFELRQKAILKLCEQTAKESADLWAWHHQKDEDGVFVWWVRKSLERAIEKLADNTETMSRNTETQTLILKSVAHQLEKMTDVLMKIDD